MVRRVRGKTRVPLYLRGRDVLNVLNVGNVAVLKVVVMFTDRMIGGVVNYGG